VKHHFSDSVDPVQSPNRLFFLFSAALLFGVVCGVITAYFLDFNAQQALYSDVTGFLSDPRSDTVSIWQSLWSIGRIPLMIVLLAFTCFGVIGVPVSVGMQGYLLSFTTAVMVRLLGFKGLLLGIAGFGIQALFLIPCILLWSTQSFSVSKQFLKMLIPTKHAEPQGMIVFPRGFFFALFLGVVMLIFGAILDYFFARQLISFVSNTFILH